MKPQFVHHHVHGMHSLLDGLSSPMDIAQRIHELGMPGWSHTDHGTLAGAYDVTKAAQQTLGVSCISLRTGTKNSRTVTGSSTTTSSP